MEKKFYFLTFDACGLFSRIVSAQLIECIAWLFLLGFFFLRLSCKMYILILILRLFFQTVHTNVLNDLSWFFSVCKCSVLCLPRGNSNIHVLIRNIFQSIRLAEYLQLTHVCLQCCCSHLLLFPPFVGRNNRNRALRISTLLLIL